MKMIVLVIGNILFWLAFVLSGEAVALAVGILNFLGIVCVALINAAQNRRITQMSKNVDGKMDALLAANKRADLLEGAEKGRAEIKQETSDKQEEPTEVIVVKPAEVIVVKTKEEGK